MKENITIIKTDVLNEKLKAAACAQRPQERLVSIASRGLLRKVKLRNISGSSFKSPAKSSGRTISTR